MSESQIITDEKLPNIHPGEILKEKGICSVLFCSRLCFPTLLCQAVLLLWEHSSKVFWIVQMRAAGGTTFERHNGVCARTRLSTAHKAMDNRAGKRSLRDWAGIGVFSAGRDLETGLDNLCVCVHFYCFEF